MSERDTKVLGVVANVANKQTMLCSGNSCIVAESEQKIKEYIKRQLGDNQANFQFSKVRYGQILKDLKLGGSYSFDFGAYSKFYPLAIQDGLNLVPLESNKPAVPGDTFVEYFKVELLKKH